jgi:hypothetical protein
MLRFIALRRILERIRQAGRGRHHHFAGKGGRGGGGEEGGAEELAREVRRMVVSLKKENKARNIHRYITFCHASVKPAQGGFLIYCI